jgi:hypothetical protein
MWRPDRASRCEAPLSRNTWTVSRLSPLRSPVRNALSSGAVVPLGNGILSMKARSRSAGPAAHLSRKVLSLPPGKDAVRKQTAPHRRKTGKSSPVFSFFRTAARLTLTE